MAMRFGAVLTLQDNFTAVMKNAVKQQSKFKQDLERTRQAITRMERAKDKAFAKKMELRVQNSKANKVIQDIIKKHDGMRKRLIRVIATTINLKDKVTSKMNKVISLGKRLTKPFTVQLNVKDKVTGVVNSLGAKLTALGVTAGAGVAVGGSIKSGALLEQQQISMRHFIGVNNQGKNTKELDNMANTYLSSLRKEANATPFSSTEVVSAGARAINISQGNTKQAMELVKLAEDMASLNPEKTLSDAIEALADSKLGEFERLKEFGFKVSAEEFKGYVGKGKNDDLTEKETNLAYSKLVSSKLNPYFDGGAKKLSTSGSGLWNALTGNIQSKAQDAGLKVLEQLKPVLASAIKYFDAISPKIDAMIGKIGVGVEKLSPIFNGFGSMVKAVMPTVSNVFQITMGNVGKVIDVVKQNMRLFKGIATDVFNGVSVVVPYAINLMKPSFDIFLGIFKALITVVRVVYPVFKYVFTSVWEILQPIIVKLTNVLQTFATFLNSDNFIGTVKTVFGGVMSAVQTMYDFVKPLIEGLASIIGGMLDGLGKVGDWITDKGSKATSIISEAREINRQVLANNSNNLSGGGGEPQAMSRAYKPRAIGVNRVPYDGYKILAHEGEKLLTKQEARQYEGGSKGITISKLADSIVVREEADIDKIANKLVARIDEARFNFGGAY